MTEPLQTAEDIARCYKVSARMMLRLAQRGDIPCLRIGRLVRFDPEAVRDALGQPARQREGPR